MPAPSASCRSTPGVTGSDPAGANGSGGSYGVLPAATATPNHPPNRRKGLRLLSHKGPAGCGRPNALTSDFAGPPSLYIRRSGVLISPRGETDNVV
jgi:hypothetical protein